MRVLWIISANENAVAQFEQALDPSRSGCEYLVRRAESLKQIPESHLSHSGVAFVLDPFNAEHPGFEGLKKLRSMGFAGHIFVAGEPSPETAEEAFAKYQLSGFFGSLDRIDYILAGGVIHSSFHYKDELDLRMFLDNGGRASEEKIANSAEFTHFVQTLGNFVSRFGIGAQLVKKVLMGLTLGHMKMGATGPSFEGNFTVRFGIDKKKLILSLRGLSKGCAPEVILSEFTQSVLSLGSSHAPRASLFPDMHHVVRSAHSLQLFSGNCEGKDPGVDPLSLLTVISFPHSVVNNEISAQWFGYTHVKKSEDMPSELAHAPLLQAIAAESTQLGEASLNGPQVIDQSDLQKILADPALLTDITAIDGMASHDVIDQVGVKFEEIQREPSVSEGSQEFGGDAGETEFRDFGSEASSSEGYAEADSQRVQELTAEVEELKRVSAAMANDLQRLMKERREPTTDRELREAKTELEERNKKLTADRRRLEEAIVLKDKDIHDLKARIEELRTRSAA